MRNIIKTKLRNGLGQVEKNRKEKGEFRLRESGIFVLFGVFINPTLIDVPFAFALFLSQISEP